MCQCSFFQASRVKYAVLAQMQTLILGEPNVKRHSEDLGICATRSRAGYVMFKGSVPNQVKCWSKGDKGSKILKGE